MRVSAGRKLGLKLIALTLAAGFFSCAASFDDPDFSLAAVGNNNGLFGQFRNTYYYSARETDYHNQYQSVDLIGLDGDVLVKVGARFKKALDIEGTGKIRDGRVVNYAGKKEGIIRYHFSDLPYGHGVGSCELFPFHSIAVDPNRIPLGSLVQIDETIGMQLPDGSTHDGTWRAEDIGGAILKDRVDLFVGEGDQGEVLTKAGITFMKPLTVRLISPPPPHPCTERPADGSRP